MKNRDFVHLHVHCQTSLLDGMGSAESYAKRAKEIGFEYLALTDHGDISGTLKWQKACENEDIVPVLGTEIYVCKDATDKKEKPRHLTVLTKNQTGWQNLLRLTTHAHNNFIKRPRADYDSVLKYSDGLIFMSACINSIMKDDDGEAFFCEQLSKKAPVFIEIMPHDHPLQKEWNKTCTEISRFYDIPMVASNDAHYVLEEDSESQEVLLAIQRGAKWNDPNRWKFDFKRLHLKTADEMIFDFEKIKIPRSVYLPAMRRTLDVARMCGDFRIEKKPVHLPLPPGISGDEFKFLENLCVQGYYDKIGSLIEPEYDQRISYELDIIQRKGFVRYFLIVWDLIRFCRLQNMTPSPGRGSVGCSLVAFLLGITKVDPVLYHLPFSRFINEERLDSPDIDLDFPDNKRDSVFKYLKETYGENNVAGISTFLRMQARLVIRDVSRVFDVDLKEVDSFAKTIEKSVQEGIDFEIEKKTKEESFHLKYPDVIKHALKLEGQVRGYSRHAAGAAISYEPLSDGRQAYLAERGETTVVGWDMSDCEYVGLLKLDILGLKFLTVLGYAKELIQQNHDVKLDFDKIPLDDSRVYKELSNGNFTGIFQMGWAIQDVVRRAGVANIREWSDAIALGRPGPLDSGQTDEYIRRKHGAEWTKKHPIYEEVTRQTYGVECIHEDTLVSLPNGNHKPIKHIKSGENVISVNSQLISETSHCLNCTKTRFGNGIKIILSNGMSVTVTGDHEVYTFDGWKRADCLDQNDLVAVPFSSCKIDEEKVDIAKWLGTNEDVSYLLGYMTGNGSNKGSVSLCCGVEWKADILESWISHKLPKIRIKKYFNVRSWYLGISCPELLNESSNGNRKTKFIKLIESLGLNCLSINKYVPSIIMAGDDCVKASFLAGLFDSDGHIGSSNKRKGAAVCNISSSSPMMIEDISRLLQYFKIAHSIYPNHIFIWNIVEFKHIVGKYIKIRSFNGLKLSDGKSIQFAPKRLLIETFHKSGLSARQFEKKFNIRRCLLSSNNNNFLRGITINRLGASFGDVIFYPIKSTKIVKDQQFYRISVDPNHNLIGDCILIKNCYQETTMNVFHKVAGLPYATADKIRKVIGKKRDPKEFEPYHDMFLEGCRKQQTLSDKEVEVFWDGLLKCARYQFNKSHSLAYAILGYWTLYTKVYYPAEYMAAFLTHGSDKYQDEMVKNARAIGLQLVPPKIGISDATRWQAKSNKLYLPFSAIDGIGEKTALEIAAGGRKRKTKKKKGFLGEKEEMYFTPSVKTTLDNIMAFDPEAPLPKSALHYFSKISMSADYRETHPSLLNLLGRRSQSIELVEQAVRGELEMNLCRLQDKFRLNPELQKCRKCSLRQECSRPVNPSPSDHNMMIIGQDPGKNEDRLGVGFVGNAGDVLWEELKRYDLTRDMFHVTNTNKCFPSKSKKSSTEQIETCREWLDEEIRFVNPYIILVLGSNAMYFFTGQDKGITQRNATIEWNEGYSCYLSFCLHPSSTLHSPKNKGEFQRGIEFFSKKIELIGGI